MPSTLGLGQLRRLLSLADYDGRLQLVALDLPPGSAALDPEAVEPPSYAVLAEQLELAARLLSTQASGVVLHPASGLAHAGGSVDRGAGLVVSLNAADGPGLLADWSVGKAAKCGAAAVKLEVSWLGTEADQQAVELATMVGDECAKHELPLLLVVELPEPAAEAGPPELLERVVAATKALSSDEVQAALLALPLPVPVGRVGAYAHGLCGVLGEPLCSLAEAAELYESLDAACGVPWLVSVDGNPAELVATVELAARAGASGFLAGPAFWRGALAEYPDRVAVEAALTTEALPTLAQAIAGASRGRPWYDHVQYGGLDQVAVRDAGEDWFRSY